MGTRGGRLETPDVLPEKCEGASTGRAFRRSPRPFLRYARDTGRGIVQARVQWNARHRLGAGTVPLPSQDRHDSEGDQA